MQNHLHIINKKLKQTKRLLLKDNVLEKDIDFSYNFIPPYSKAEKISDIKIIFIGQDPTVRRKESREEINYTLNLDKENSLKTYLKKVCQVLQVNIETEVYATNLYKCFFNFPPADDETILTRHFKIWNDLLINELNAFKNSIIITLGEPLIKQLIHAENRKVKYYWDYIGNTKSGGKFKFVKPHENYLQERIYPIAHQRTWNQNRFYNTYLQDYLEFIKQSEK